MDRVVVMHDLAFGKLRSAAASFVGIISSGPAVMNDIVVEPQYTLNEAKTDYISIIAPNTPTTKLPHPMPIAITFFAGQDAEPTLIQIGTAYESATHHRTPPPAFGPPAANLSQAKPPQ